MRKILALLLFLAFLAAGYYAYQSGLAAELSDYDRLVETLRRDGLWGPLRRVAIASPYELIRVSQEFIPRASRRGDASSWCGESGGRPAADRS